MDATSGGEPERLAPVTPLFGGPSPSRPDADVRSSQHHPARGAAPGSAPRLRAIRSGAEQTSDAEQREAHRYSSSPRGEERPVAPQAQADDPARLRGAAEELLVRKLRARSLSVAEATTILKGYESQGVRVPAEQIADIIDDFCGRGYLDDALLAAHLVTSGVERKGQGRAALSRALAQRGIPRDVIDAALEELPDDDAERALEYARTKARSMSRLDADTALRRLVGQLARRGYGGSLAMNAAKQALAEASFGASTSGVRFVESD